MGGAAGGSGGEGAVNGFQGGPCVAMDPADHAQAFVFARGRDNRVYRAAPAVGMGWTELAGLDGALLAAGTDLDCATARLSSPSDAVTYISGLGGMPVGQIRLATGSGTTFATFAPVIPLGGGTFTTTPSIVAWSTDGWYDVLITNPGTPAGVMALSQAAIQSESVWPTPDTAPTPPSLVSGVDASDSGSGSGYGALTAGINENGEVQLVRYIEINGGQFTEWGEPQYFPPPNSLALQHSPAVCRYRTSSQAMHTYLVVVAGDRLWYTVDKLGGTGFSSWQQLSDAEVASAPDCYFYDSVEGGLVHVVALTPSGSVLHIEGRDGTPFAETDLGVY